MYVVLDQGSRGPDLWAVLTSIAPFVVSLVALGGAIFAAWYSGKKSLQAEDRRAAAALEAEDRRAKAAIEAEDRRHDHEITHDATTWRRDASADAYFKLIGSLSAEVHALTQVRWFARNAAGASAPYRAYSVKTMGKHVEAWNNFTSEANLLVSTIRAIGNPTIADRAADMLVASSKTLELIEGAHLAALDGGPPYDEHGVAEAELRHLEKERDSLVGMIRVELGAGPKVAPSFLAPQSP